MGAGLSAQQVAALILFALARSQGDPTNHACRCQRVTDLRNSGRQPCGDAGTSVATGTSGSTGTSVTTGSVVFSGATTVLSIGFAASIFWLPVASVTTAGPASEVGSTALEHATVVTSVRVNIPPLRSFLNLCSLFIIILMQCRLERSFWSQPER